MSKGAEDHRIHNRSSNLPFAEIIERRLSRRSVMCDGPGAPTTLLGASRGADAANPCPDNSHGQVIRWRARRPPRCARAPRRWWFSAVMADVSARRRRAGCC